MQNWVDAFSELTDVIMDGAGEADEDSLIGQMGEEEDGVVMEPMIVVNGNDTSVEIVPVPVSETADYNSTVVDPALAPDNHPGYLEPDYLP